MKKNFISLVLILTLSINISTTDAFSAVKSYKTGDIHDEAYYVEYDNMPVEIADKFFTYQKGCVYASDDIENKGTKIISVSSKYDLNGTILTNGSKVYYSVRNGVASVPKTTIYSVDINGKNKQKIISFKTPLGNLEPLAYYDGILYLREYIHQIQKGGAVYPARYYVIHAYNLKAKTIKKITQREVVSNPEATVVYGRYIYMNTFDKRNDMMEGFKNPRVYVYDMKTKKISKMKNGSIADVTISANKLYYSVYGVSGEKIYTCALSGKGTKTLILELPEYSSIDKITSEKIYYERYFDEDWIYSESQYCCYDIKSKTTQRLEFDEYQKIVGDVAYW